MTQNIQKMHTQDTAADVAQPADADSKQDALYYNTLTLSRFIRANYGDSAVQ